MEAVLPPKKREPYYDNPHAFLEALVTNKTLRESTSFRGALSFWDVFPEPPGNNLGVDILNPHHGGYYQDGTTPADCESPVPNFFLVMPPKTGFAFHVQCEANRLPEQLCHQWKKLIQATFDHAFDWFGFGAKTAVGYGQFSRTTQLTPARPNPNGDIPASKAATLSRQPEQSIWECALLGWNPGNATLQATPTEGGRKAEIKLGTDRTLVPDEIINRIRKGKTVRAKVTVEPLGGKSFRIIKVEV